MKKLSKSTICIIIGVVLILSGVIIFLIPKKGGGGDYTDDGRMILNLRNLYFSEWTGDDPYTEALEKKFGVKINPSPYSWADWNNQVYAPINSNSEHLSDVFHFSLDNYNYTNSYVFWAKGKVIKPLPDDMSKWPNVQSLLNGINNIDDLKIDGKLYCIPIAKNIKAVEADYSPFTYVYRRDWAKELGVYKENDVYTWQEFKNLIKAFYENKSKPTGEKIAAIADVKWGFPSILNFYKDAPHCYTLDESGKVVSNFATETFMEGLDLAKEWSCEKNAKYPPSSSAVKYYSYGQYSANEGDVRKAFVGGTVGIFYENLSLSNYTTIRREIEKNLQDKSKLDDMTAILKVSGPDGMYALEGTDNWFSATFFNADISDEKMGKILDIMNWLLSDEGTEMALYGKEGYDYEKDSSGNVTLLENGWEMVDGKYVDKLNGVKYLRYMCTLGYDLNNYDPLVDKKALSVLNDWYSFMDAQKAKNKLRVLKEDSSVKWLSSELKSKNSGALLDEANTAVINYVYGKISKEQYQATFKSELWNRVLNEINTTLGK